MVVSVTEVTYDDQRWGKALFHRRPLPDRRTAALARALRLPVQDLTNLSQHTLEDRAHRRPHHVAMMTNERQRHIDWRSCADA